MPAGDIYELSVDAQYNGQNVTNVMHMVQIGADGSGDARVAVNAIWVGVFDAPQRVLQVTSVTHTQRRRTNARSSGCTAHWRCVRASDIRSCTGYRSSKSWRGECRRPSAIFRISTASTSSSTNPTFQADSFLEWPFSVPIA